MPAKIQPALVLTIRSGNISRLTTLLQRGFLVPCSTSVTLYDFLLSLPGFNLDYITDRIETIFINGCASDSLQHPLIPGSTLALSAAMPGLAGAIFRKGGAHASLRSKPGRSQPLPAATDGFITVKLFNMIATDKGEELLTRGILVNGPTLARFFHRQQKRLQPPLIDIRQNATSITLADALLLAKSHSRIKLRVDDMG